MAPARSRRTNLLILALGAATLLSWIVTAALERNYLQPGLVANFLADSAATFATVFVIVLCVAVVFRVAATGFRRRGEGEAARTIGRLETVVAVAAAVLFVLVGGGRVNDAFLSLGLVGFGVTFALQRPILALAGWASITFGGLFREGDRIEVAGMVGDVLEINLLTTRLWEIGSPSSPLTSASRGSLRATGRIVTVSNAVFLEHPMANATSDVPFVFDEFVVALAYEADLALAERLLTEAGQAVLDPRAHRLAATQYQRLTADMPMEERFPLQPEVIASLQDSWIELRLRYLVDVRSRAAVRTRLAKAWLASSSQHPDALPNVYARVQQQVVGRDGRPKD